MKEAAEFVSLGEDKDQGRKGIAIYDHIKVNQVLSGDFNDFAVPSKSNDSDRKMQNPCCGWRSWLLSWFE